MRQSSLMRSRSRRPLSLDDVRVAEEVLGNKSLDNISESYDDDSGVFVNSSSSFLSSEGKGKLSFDITSTPVRTSTPNPQRRLYSCPEGTSIAFPPLLSIEGLFAEINDDIGPSWRKLGRFLLNNRECLLNNIDADFNGVSEKAYQVLLKWKEVSGDTATPKALFLALLQLKRTDVAKKLIKLAPSLNALSHLLDSVVPSGSTLYNNSSRLNPENLQVERTILSQDEKVLVCSNTETSQRFVLKQVEGEGKAFGVRKCIDCKALRQQSHRLRKTEEFLKELEMKQKMVQDLLGVTQQLQNHLHTQHQAISQAQFSCRNCEQYTIKKDLVQKELTLLHYELQRMIQSNRRISVSGIPSERIFNLATRTYTVCEEHREMHLQSRRRRSVCHHPEDTMDSEDNDDPIQGPLMCAFNVITGIARRRKVTQSLKTKKTSGNNKLKLAKSNSNPLSSRGDELSHRHSYFLAQENPIRMPNLLVQRAGDWSGVPAFKMCSDFKKLSASSNSEDSSRDTSQQTRCPKDQQINSSTSLISENDQSLQWLKGLEPDEMII